MPNSWHSFSIEKVFRELGTGPEGISEREAKQRLKTYGANALREGKPVSRLLIFVRQFKSPLVYILLIAGLIALVLRDFSDTLIIFIAVLLNATVGYFQEEKAGAALAQLKKIIRVKAIVFRESEEKEIFQEELVPGDVVFLRAGRKVPADARLIEVYNLTVNESVLTGEWLAAEKSVGLLSEDTALADRDNMAYLGTVVESGWAKAVVTETGSRTEIGQVSEMVRQKKNRKTPYQYKLYRFSRIIGAIIMFFCAGIFVEGMLTDRGFIEMLTTSVAVAVAAIPEGLPVAMTVILALGMQKILRRKGLVRKLASAESLGSTSVILTDKTGTLTEARMAVAGIYTGTGELFGHRMAEYVDKNGKESHITALKIAMLCNESFVENLDKPTKKWIVRGTPTERALLLAGISAGLSKKELERQYPILDQVLFNSDLKYAASLRRFDGEENMLYLVGSPERILEFCSGMDDDGRIKELTDDEGDKIWRKFEELTKKGLRVIGVGYRKTKKGKIDLGKEKTEKKAVFVGFFALHDPIRVETKEVMGLCRSAGIHPVIVTGDHKLTAAAVAEALGFKTGPENIIEGKDLARLSEARFQERLEELEIYARVEPAQKLRIVRAWQARGEVVAMTGDGVNDAPALRQADIGVALGSGTDVAKEVSDLVLLDDNFKIIASAVEQGRAIVDNIRKVITYLLSDSFSEVILVAASLFLGLPLPILGAQILWVNLIEDGPLGICLAFEKKEEDVMRQKPSSYRSRMLNWEMKVLIFVIGIMTDIFLLGLFLWLLRYSGYAIEHIRSVVFAALTIDSIFYIFSCKSLRHNIWQIGFWSNKFLLYSWVFGAIMLLAALYVPFLNDLLKTTPLNSFDWCLILALGLVNMILIETTKRLFIVRKLV